MTRAGKGAGACSLHISPRQMLGCSSTLILPSMKGLWTAKGLQRGAWNRGCTKLIWEPEMVCEEIGHVVVQPFQHIQGIVNKEDGVVIAVQHPLEVLVPMKMGSQKWGHACPVTISQKHTLSLLHVTACHPKSPKCKSYTDLCHLFCRGACNTFSGCPCDSKYAVGEEQVVSITAVLMGSAVAPCVMQVSAAKVL